MLWSKCLAKGTNLPCKAWTKLSSLGFHGAFLDAGKAEATAE